MMRLEVPTIIFFDPSFGDESASKGKKQSGCPLIDNCRSSAFKPSTLNKWLDAFAKLQEVQKYGKKSAANSEPKKTATSNTRSDVFAHTFDVHSFEPSEISVKMDDDTLVVSGKHEHTSDDGQYELREYVRKVKVPENVLVEQMQCKLDEKSGQLQVEAPLKKPTEEKSAERIIPIEFVNQKKPVTEPEKDTALD